MSRVKLTEEEYKRAEKVFAETVSDGYPHFGNVMRLSRLTLDQVKKAWNYGAPHVGLEPLCYKYTPAPPPKPPKPPKPPEDLTAYDACIAPPAPPAEPAAAPVPTVVRSPFSIPGVTIRDHTSVVRANMGSRQDSGAPVADVSDRVEALSNAVRDPVVHATQALPPTAATAPTRPQPSPEPTQAQAQPIPPPQQTPAQALPTQPESVSLAGVQRGTISQDLVTIDSAMTKLVAGRARVLLKEMEALEANRALLHGLSVSGHNLLVAYQPVLQKMIADRMNPDGTLMRRINEASVLEDIDKLCNIIQKVQNTLSANMSASRLLMNMPQTISETRGTRAGGDTPEDLDEKAEKLSRLLSRRQDPSVIDVAPYTGEEAVPNPKDPQG